MSSSSIYLGTSGWSYSDWLGVLYPRGTSSSGYLATYTQYFDTVEIDSTFYAIPSASTVAGWRDRTPDNFVFAAKVPRSITHDRQLMDVAGEIMAFANAMRGLGTKCGPLLFQFAPSFTVEHWDNLAALLPLLPNDLRWAIEVRHTSWLQDQFYDLLRSHNIALAHVDLPWIPRNTPATADFVYIRWLGDRKQLSEDFSYVRSEFARDDDLDWWARQIERLSEAGIDVYGYANNHYQGHSPATIRVIQHRLGLPVSEPQLDPQQPSLFS